MGKHYNIQHNLPSAVRPTGRKEKYVMQMLNSALQKTW